jgi:hypothetical protein
MRSNLKYRLGTYRIMPAKTWVEKPSVMNPELADSRVVGNHLGCEMGWNADGLSGY